jgi:hypothetical protein
MTIQLHPDWELVEELENDPSDLCHQAAALIRQLKKELNRANDKASRLEFPE